MKLITIYYRYLVCFSDRTVDIDIHFFRISKNFLHISDLLFMSCYYMSLNIKVKT